MKICLLVLILLAAGCRTYAKPIAVYDGETITDENCLDRPGRGTWCWEEQTVISGWHR